MSLPVQKDRQKLNWLSDKYACLSGFCWFCASSHLLFPHLQSVLVCFHFFNVPPFRLDQTQQVPYSIRSTLRGLASLRIDLCHLEALFA